MFVTLNILPGALSFITVVIFVTVGIKIAMNYAFQNQKSFLYAGLTLIFLISPYYPDAVNFILILFLGTQLNAMSYLLLAIGFVAIATITWPRVYGEMMENKQRKKMFVISFLLLGLSFELFLVYAIIFDLSLLGVLVSPFIAEFGVIVDIFFGINLIGFLTSGLLFVRKTLKTENLEIKLKGKFMAIAVLLYTIVNVFEISILLDEASLILFRILLGISAISFYIAFNLPNWIQKILIKNKPLTGMV